MLKEKMMENKKKVVVACAVGVLLCAGVAGAYFTDSQSVTNLFTTGGVDSVLTEPLYDKEDPAERQNIAPGKIMTKDPTVTNDDTLDMYTFLKVNVPVKSLKTFDPATGQVVAEKLQPLFSWGVNDGWTEVKKVENEDGTWDFYYAYGSDKNMTPIAPGQSTSVLFKDNQIQFINAIEGQGVENLNLEVTVTDYSGQTTDLGTQVPAEILDIYMNHR